MGGTDSCSKDIGRVFFLWPHEVESKVEGLEGQGLGD